MGIKSQTNLNEYTPQLPTWVFFAMYLPFFLGRHTFYSQVFGDWREVTQPQLQTSRKRKVTQPQHKLKHSHKLEKLSREDDFGRLQRRRFLRNACGKDDFGEDVIGDDNLRISDDKQQYRLKRLGFKRRIMKLVVFFSHRKFSQKKMIHCLSFLLIRIITVINDVDIVISDMNLFS